MRVTRAFRLGFTGEAERIVSGMTVEEKVALMSGTTSLQQVNERKQAGYHFGYQPFPAGGSVTYGIQPFLFADGTRGAVCGSGGTTCFPVPVLRAASFDARLEERIGAAIARELLASGANLYGGVCVNLPYHPGWGRSQESYGEDPAVAGTLGAALVRGVQSEGVIACVKHFAWRRLHVGDRRNVTWKIHI